MADNEFFGNWVNSGDLSLDCQSGIIYVAFVYRGSDLEAFGGTYELDEIKMTSN